VNRRAREVETLALTMLAAVPLYLNYAIGKVPLVAFHVLMGLTLIRVAMGRGPELIPAKVMRALAFAYIPFYVIDAAMISRSAIAASTHLILFIAAYQPTEALHRNNLSQRLLTTALVFIASLATSTHISIVLFVILFGFLMFRQMIYVSHMDSVRSIDHQYELAPASKAAGFYLAGATLIGALLFPLLPRLRNPMVQGFTGALQNATTGLSDSIDFNESRSSTPDPTVVARVWMSRQAMPFFTPLRRRVRQLRSQPLAADAGHGPRGAGAQRVLSRGRSGRLRPRGHRAAAPHAGPPLPSEQHLLHLRSPVALRRPDPRHLHDLHRSRRHGHL
jgi:hypothetical protein